MKELRDAIEAWVALHPHLKEIGRLQQLVLWVWDQHAPAGDLKEPVVNWHEVKRELQRGKPAITVAAWHEVMVRQAAVLLQQMTAAFAAADLPGELRRQAQRLQALFEDQPELPGRLIQDALADQGPGLAELERAGVSPGVAVFFLWSVLPRLLQPLIQQVESWQQSGQWERAYCPVCGQLPAMAHLVRTGKGRERELVCGRCQTRWHYKRMGCPYCESDDYGALKILEPHGAPDWRIDTCDHCRGYLKTYTGEGNEAVALADWSTLHFDVIGQNRGFQRFGFQRYQI
ncbi:MAG TPA: formate dehydrogenase accessory protein FdhE [Clostridia bacterium]|nr:formate dehydrogenase accessory protein FdhE [Clostridia bacterium]